MHIGMIRDLGVRPGAIKNRNHFGVRFSMGQNVFDGLGQPDFIPGRDEHRKSRHNPSSRLSSAALPQWGSVKTGATPTMLPVVEDKPFGVFTVITGAPTSNCAHRRL